MTKTLLYQTEVDETIYDELLKEIDSLVKSKLESVVVGSNEKFILKYNANTDIYALIPKSKPANSKVKFSTPRFKIKKS